MSRCSSRDVNFDRQPRTGVVENELGVDLSGERTHEAQAQSAVPHRIKSFRQADAVVRDDWRFAKRMPSRAAAIRELLKRGLAAEGFDLAKPSRKSKEFGVIANQAAPTNGKAGRPR